MKRFRWFVIPCILLIIWLINTSRVGGRPDGCLRDCSSSNERGEGPLRIMSLNVLHDFPHFRYLHQRLDLIVNEIMRQDADIVCLQEVPWTLRLGNGARYIAERVGMNYLYLRANGNRWAIFFEEGEAILSRFPLNNPGGTELKPQADLFEHRVVLHVDVSTPWGDTRVYVTHLTDEDPAINKAQASSLMSYVGKTMGGVGIVTGDFNAVEESPQIEAFARDWIDVKLVANPHEEGNTCCIDDLTREDVKPLYKRIDYIFIVPGSQNSVSVIGNHKVLDNPFWVDEGWLWASDHVGLLTTLKIEP